MLYELLSEVYVDAYSYDSFDYDMDVYYDYLWSYSGSYEDNQIPMSLFLYIFSSYSSFWDKFGAVLSVALLILFGGGSLVGNRGGGGSNGGMGIFRRKR